MNGANLDCWVFWLLLLQYIHLTYLLALKKAMKHCDFMSNIKIFRFIPVTETDTIMDAEICVSHICSSCDFPVVMHLIELFTAWQSVYEGISDQNNYFYIILKSFKWFDEIQVQKWIGALIYLPLTLSRCVWVILQLLRKTYNLFTQTLNLNCTKE